MTTKMGRRQIIAKVVATIAMALLGAIFVATGTVAANDNVVHIAAFGDSLTAGYGLPPGADFASRLEAALRKRGHLVRVSNAGVSGDTTSGGLARFDWAVSVETDAVILELGANDALRGIAPGIARDNLDKILAKLAARKVPVLVAGMRAPANWGATYEKKFNTMFAELAEKYNALLYPFFLEGVIDKPELKLADALHPNKAGVDEVVRRILPTVENLISRVRKP